MGSNWFPHDYNARNDLSMLKLRKEQGAEGYGLWWMLIETIASQGKIDKDAIGAIAMSLSMDAEKLQKFINYCLSEELLYEENGALKNKEMDAHRQHREECQKAGKRGADKRWNSKQQTEKEKDGNGDPNSPPMAITGHNTTGQDITKQDNGVEQPTNHPISEEQQNLNDYLKKNYPEVWKLPKKPTVKDMSYLRANYGKPAVDDALERMDNYKKLTTNYKSIYKTLKNWLQKDFGKPTKDADSNEMKPKCTPKWFNGYLPQLS